MGAALEQRSGDLWKPLGFFSQLFTPAQKKYSTYDRGLTAIYEAIRYFRHYLEGVEFKIYTDHKPLVYELVYNFKLKSITSNLHVTQDLADHALLFIIPCATKDYTSLRSQIRTKNHHCS